MLRSFYVYRVYATVLLCGVPSLLQGADPQAVSSSAPAPAAASQRPEAVSHDPLQMLYRCRETFRSVRDFTAIIRRRERLDGQLQPEETIFMKFRVTPFSVYLHWIREPHRTREVIYVEGQNDDLIIGHEVIGPINFMMKVSPDAVEARRASHRSIRDAGIGRAIESLLRVCEVARKAGDLKMFYAGVESLNGRPAHVVLRMLPQKPEYPYHLMIVFIDQQLNLPVKFVSLDWDYQPVAIFTYSDLRLNVGLTDEDFNYKSDRYNFPGIIPLAKPRIPKW